MKTKINFLFYIFFFVFTALIFRISYLKISYGRQYTSMSLKQQASSIDKAYHAKRGSITDRNGSVIAESIPIYDIVLEPKTLTELNNSSRQKSTERTLSSLSEILSIPQNKLNEYLSLNPDGSLKYSPYYQVIYKNADSATADKIRSLKLNGVYLEEKEKRRYPFSDLASKVIGFEHGGTLYGIENTYNSYLTGIDGRSFCSITGTETEIIDIPAQNGYTVMSTIDMNIQKIAADVIKEAMESYPCETASIIIMNPQTGEILAMTDSMDFDLNNPSKPVNITESDFNRLSTEKQSDYLNNMWKNFNIYSTFEPGSIFKPLIAGAALDEGIINKNTSFYCAGFKQVNDRKIHCIRRTGHFSQTLEQAISNSCNCVMMDIAEKMGKELFYKYQKDFGFGEKTGIDLPSETGASSLLYGPDRLGPVELATSSFGQSFNATALQSLTALCSIANGGKLIKPRIVSGIIDTNGNVIKEFAPETKRCVLSEDTCREISDLMVSVVENGTGRKAKIEGYTIAAKSGTGEQGNRNDELYTITFAGFLPAENPAVAAIVVIDKPAEYADGVTTAAPAFKSLMEKTIKYMGIEPSYKPKKQVNASQAEIPDYTGFYAEDALALITDSCMEYKIVGCGSKIINQFPKPGSYVPEGADIILYTD